MPPHQALGLGEGVKGLKKENLLPSKTICLAPGEQEMPREEQQEKVPWERAHFSAGLVGEGSADTGNGEAAAHGGKRLLEVKALSLLPAEPQGLSAAWRTAPSPPTSVALQQSSPLPCSAAPWLSSSGCCSCSPCRAGGGGDAPGAPRIPWDAGTGDARPQRGPQPGGDGAGGQPGVAGSSSPPLLPSP